MEFYSSDFNLNEFNEKFFNIFFKKELMFLANRYLDIDR